MKTAIITPAIVNPDLLYGAERHYVGMVQAFRKQVDTEWIQVPISEYNWESVLQGYLDCYHLDLSRFDVVVSTKNPTYMAQHEHHVCWLLHQMRVFYDRFDDEYGRLPAKAWPVYGSTATSFIASTRWACERCGISSPMATKPPAA